MMKGDPQFYQGGQRQSIGQTCIAFQHRKVYKGRPESEVSLALYPDEHVPAYRWVVIGSLTTCAATSLTSMFVLGLLLPDISEDLSLSPSQQGWLASSLVFANLVLAIPMNLYLSRFRPWRTASIAFMGVALFTLVQGWAPAFALLILGQVLDLGALPLALPQTAQAQRRSQLQRLGLLAAGDVEGLLKTDFRLNIMLCGARQMLCGARQWSLSARYDTRPSRCSKSTT